MLTVHGRWAALTIDDMKHLDNKQIYTKKRLVYVRRWQRANKLHCAQCEEIEAKIKALRIKNKQLGAERYAKSKLKMSIFPDGKENLANNQAHSSTHVPLNNPGQT